MAAGLKSGAVAEDPTVRPGCGGQDWSAHAAPSRWDEVAGQPSPSWYLDPAVASQKRRIHQDLIREWTGGAAPETILKTDLFEEAYGDDHILFDLFPEPHRVIGFDVAAAAVRHASRRCPRQEARFLVSDVRSLALRTGSADLILSISTLDHFDSKAEFRAALAELARVLQPGGRLIVTLDNPHNPMYRVLRRLTRLRLGPFPLGYTESRAELVRSLDKAGLEVTGTALLIHNPRLISTLMFLALRRLLCGRADWPIRKLLRLFEALGSLPTRSFTACFVAACARKPAATEASLR